MELSRKSPRRARGALSSMTNPLILKLCRIEETSADHVTYAGIARKCEFFMLMNVLGIFLALPLDRMGPVFTFDAENIAGISAAGAIGAAISGLIFLLTPLLAFIIKRTIPVTGALYCMSTGFLFTLISGAAPEYRGLVLLAMAITIAIVLVLILQCDYQRITLKTPCNKLACNHHLSRIFQSLLLDDFVEQLLVVILRDTG